VPHQKIACESEDFDFYPYLVALSSADANILADTVVASSPYYHSTVVAERQDAHIEGYDRVAKEIKQRQRRLTKLEVMQVIVDYKAGATVNELAKKYDCKRTTISRHLKNNGIEIVSRSLATRGREQEIVKLYVEGGLNAYKVAERFGINQKTVLDCLHKQGVELRPNNRWKNYRQ
jgi:transposase-like protein